MHKGAVLVYPYRQAVKIVKKSDYNASQALCSPVGSPSAISFTMDSTVGIIVSRDFAQAAHPPLVLLSKYFKASASGIRAVTFNVLTSSTNWATPTAKSSAD